MLYEEHQSTSTTRSTVKGVGIGGSGPMVGLGSAKSSSFSTSQLERRVAPPDKLNLVDPSGASFAGFLLVLLIAALVGYFVYQSRGILWAIPASVVAFIVGSILAPHGDAPPKVSLYEKAMKEWRSSYLCLRCGETAVADSEGRLRLRENDTYPEVDLQLKAGSRVQAVKAMRDRTGLGLADAMARVDARARQLGL